MLLKPLPCEEGFTWQAEHVVGVPLNAPPVWQRWQVTLRWAPVSGNDALSWLNVQSVQVVALWQAAQSLPKAPLCRSFAAWHPMHDIGCLLYTSDAADDLLCVDLG